MPSIQSTRAYAAASATVSTTVLPITNAAFNFTSLEDGLLSATPAELLALADEAVITAHDQPVTFGKGLAPDPAATLGTRILAGETAKVVGNGNVRGLRFIRAGATDVVVSITLSKVPG